MSQLVQRMYDRFGEAHMAEYDWALTEARKECIRQRVMEDRQLPAFPMAVQRVSYLDGCKVYLTGGWVILRFSGTEPRVRIFAEADTIHHAKTLVGIMADFTGLPFDA